MKIFNTMVLVGSVYGEWYPIQAFPTYNTTETSPTTDMNVLIFNTLWSFLTSSSGAPDSNWLKSNKKWYSLHKCILTDDMACQWHVKFFPKLASYKLSTSPMYLGNPLHSTVYHRKHKMVYLVNLFGIGSTWNILCDRFAP